ncbi:NADH:ubiquinone oxidoreductase subunit J [Paenibacillus swuensis]|uniref:NADH-quinone oxidoreductase subunit J n=1 Tax=Paenibacillus swuensis TaxID=1178515 RepID=A0A172TIE6_9BACL|nr:NADH-quinone oxidoreductase subunit J [Paenibacillus swuensis]ANE46674.1 NADH:ubiquinone oxidoreductase subunit J [Paenibacillus swuensis]
MMSGEFMVFTFIAVCVITGAVLMVSLDKVVHSVVALAFTFIGLAGLYLLLSAEFVAFVQILIYAGAITILMIFGIMMTKHSEDGKEPHRPWHQALLFIGVVALFGILFFAIRDAVFPASEALQAGEDHVLEIGKLLYTEQVLPFELVSVLLTVAFIGAIVLAKREEE